MNDRKDSIKEKIGVIGKINMNQLTEKDLKVQKRTISLLLTQRKRGRRIISKGSMKVKSTSTTSDR